MFNHGNIGLIYAFMVFSLFAQNAIALHLDTPSNTDDGWPQSLYHLRPKVSGKQLAPQVLIVSPGTEEARTPVTPVYHQIAKTGITTLLSLMVAGLGNDSIMTDPLNHAFQGAQYKRPGDFYIGTIRNPCNYYVSLWSYNAMTNKSQMRKDLSFKENHEFFSNITESKSSAHDIQVFQSFTKHVTGNIGVYTGRLAYGYIPFSPGGANFSTRGLQSKTSNIIKKSMHDYNTSTIDCWVDTATADVDAAICLGMLERDHGVKVHWDDYERKRGPHNPSKHGPCKDYYDEEMEKFVRNKDGEVFKKFGYDKCCDSVSALAAHRTFWANTKTPRQRK